MCKGLHMDAMQEHPLMTETSNINRQHVLSISVNIYLIINQITILHKQILKTNCVDFYY